MMLNNKRHIDIVQELSFNSYPLVIQRNYGDIGIANLKIVLEAIRLIFKNIHLQNFSSILIFKSDVIDLEKLASNYQVIQNYTHLTSINNETLVIQIKSIDEIIISTENISKTDIVSTDFVYQYTPEKEMFHTNSETCELPKVPGSESCFAISTFKELDEALSHYKTSVAKYARCKNIKDAMHSDRRIFFKPQPEHLLRDSLVFVLNQRLRGEGLEVRPEQNVNESKPVDVKVIWGYTNHIAIIEIKWLGKSFNPTTNTFTSTYADSRARDGALQLANYLDLNKEQVPNHNTMGYLVVFDLRRKSTKEDTTQIHSADGFWYENKEIEYDPKFHELRKDFAVPIRMFITPQCTNNEN